MPVATAGMIPALPAGMSPEQLTAALTQMFQAGVASGAGMPGVAAMVPGARAAGGLLHGPSGRAGWAAGRLCLQQTH